MLLNNHTYYSYKYGTIRIEDLFREANAKGYRKLALTDINSTSACIDFIRRAPEFNIEPVVGVDFRNGIQQQYIGIARNNDGYAQLNRHLSAHLHANEHFTDIAPAFNNSYVVYPFDPKREYSLRENEFIGIRPSQLNKLLFSEWKHKQERMVILQPVTFRSKKDFNAHRLLRAIDNNLLLSTLPRSEEGQPDEVMPNQAKLCEAFKGHPIIIENTKRLLDDCSIQFDLTTTRNKQCLFSSVAEDIEVMRRECEKGLEFRYGTAPSNVIERMEKELRVIQEKCFSSYFLINWDMVNYARSKDYYYVGRGSGANSMVAYLLRITDVDPIELDLYFERFINPERANLPDFDIDFSSLERDDVTRYLFDRHGWEHTALVGAYSTFKGRGVVRELGKVFGMPADEINKLQSTKSYGQVDELGRLVLKYYKHIQGFPSHPSVHSSGIIISQEPITNYTATFMPPKGYPTTHFSMIEAEDIGLSKFDVLGQRGLGKIKDSVEIIRKNRGERINIHDIKSFKEDPIINKELLRTGKTIGCFYVESPAMRMLLTKLKAEDYLRLVAASSIIRPGVAQSGMMQEYIQRFHHKERREKARKALPELYKILEETYGVMVYQEDVIKVAHEFAGLTLGEADILRRGMSWKFRERNEFHKVEGKFFDNCIEKGYDESTTKDIWTQIESFGNYAFAKGHSASYAVESYQALYLKAHYPLEYMVATMNNGGGFYRMEVYVHEARKHGAKIEVPCINHSEGLTTIMGETIYLGLGFMRELERETINAILPERWDNGPFKGLRDFVKRVPISLEQLRSLIRVGAFRFTGKEKKELLWDAHFLLSDSKRSKPAASLFDVEVKEFKLPKLWKHELQDAFDEIELLGFSVSASPFELVDGLPNVYLKASALKTLVGKPVEIIGYLVHIKHTQTRTGQQQSMNFGTWLDLDGEWVDTVHFPQVAASQPFSGRGCYLIRGKVMDEFGFITIEVSKLQRLAMRNMDVASVRYIPGSQKKTLT